MNLQDLSLYLEPKSRLREGLLVSVGWSLVLCFGAAYVCYYFGAAWLLPVRVAPTLLPSSVSERLKDYSLLQTSFCSHTKTLIDWAFEVDLWKTQESSQASEQAFLGNREDLSMLLLNYSGKTGKKTPLTAAVFSAGWNAFESANSLEKPVNWLLFNYYLTNCLKSSVTRHQRVFDKLFNMNLIMKDKTIREFDKQFTTVVFGYPTVEDYYEDASPCHKLMKIGIPVLCLNSLDDAFSPDHAIPVEIAKQNPNIALILTSHGGHYGFLEGPWPRKCTYLDRIFKQFIQAVFKHGNKIITL
ncbi:LOW QUALITY PROTEIN: phospholipase ABHD3 [Liasis olivaceus]